MPIRIKILSIAVSLLIVFGIMVGVSAVLQQQVATETAEITRYHQPLATAMADFDVISFEYELLPMRLLRLDKPDQSEIDAAAAREQILAQQMQTDLEDAATVIDRAINDQALSIGNRLVFAHLEGVVNPLRQKVKPFIAVGKEVFQAIADQRFDDARRFSLGFRNYELLFGPETAQVRRAALALSDAATQSVRDKQAAIRNAAFVLFAIAAGLGLGIGLFVATAVIRTLRGLVRAAKAVGAGELSVSVPVRGRDEIGQLAGAFNTMVEELRSKERIKDTFGKFVDPRVVSGLLGGNSELVDHADRRVVTIFFSDIQGFTEISEQLTAEAMVKLLNHYLTTVTQCIRDSNGVVDKYIGDAVMAFWSPPFSPGDTHAAAACLAALAQQQAIEAMQANLADVTGLRRNAPQLIVRMGIATGEVVVGTIGSPASKSFTVIGDTVNLASRLESINKVYGTRAIIAEDTLRLAQHEVEVRELDLITVAGKIEPVRIYELLSPFGQLPAPSSDLRGEYAAGLEAYRARNWNCAEARFEDCLKIKSTDCAAAAFIDRVRELRVTPPPPDWDGVWHFEHK